jgi:hypothetical protein
MSYNGAGTFNLYTPGNPVVAGTTISSSAFNNTMSDVASGLTNVICKDGQTTITANIPFGSNKITGLAAASTSGDALSYGQANASLAGLTLTSPLAMTAAINTSQGNDIASASTIDLDSATGNLVDVTGTTTITAVTLSQGRFRLVRFTGILTLTNGASLVLPGGANITTAAGDFAMFEGYAAGVVRVAFLSRASGRPVVSNTISNSSTILGADVNLSNTANYFDGPSVNVGTTGTWMITAIATVYDPSQTNMVAKLWDGTTVFGSGYVTVEAGGVKQIVINAVVTSPAAAIKISVRDTNNTTGKILYNQSGFGKDSTITAIRLA